MTYRAVGVFEKSGTNLLEFLQTIPEWTMIEPFFVAQTPEDRDIGIGYFELIRTMMSEDKSYVELYMDFHDEEAFKKWWIDFGAVHEEIFAITLETLRSYGVSITRYFEDPTLVDVPAALPLSEFVAREDLTRFLDKF